MATVISFSFIFILVIFSVKFPNIVVQNADDDYIAVIKTNENYQRDGLLNNNLLNTKTWYDPYKTSFKANENKEELSTKIIKSPDLSYPPILNDEDQPLFSNVRGEIIEKALPAYEHATSDDLPGKGLFAPKSRQKISVLDSIYISRWLKELIFKIENESHLESTTVSFQMDSNILDKLKQLSTAKSLEISQLDNLICNLISQSIITRKESQDWILFRGYCSDIAWVAVFVSSLSLVCCIIHCTFKSYPKCMLLCCGIAFFIMWHSMSLYQQIQIYRHAELTSANIPEQCQKHNLTLYKYVKDYIGSYFITNECNKYYEVLPIDPLWEVTFLSTTLEVVNAFMYHSHSTSSQIVNYIIKQIFDGFLINIILILLLIIFIFLIINNNSKCHHKHFSRRRRSIFRNYVSKFYSVVTSLKKVFIGASCSRTSRQEENYSDTDSEEDNPRRPSASSRSRHIPGHLCHPRARCPICATSGHSESENDDDDDSDDSSDDGFNDHSDSQSCPCCVANRELVQELHVGCRDCASKNAANRGVRNTGINNAENLSRDEETDSAEESRIHYFDQSRPSTGQ